MYPIETMRFFDRKLVLNISIRFFLPEMVIKIYYFPNFLGKDLGSYLVHLYLRHYIYIIKKNVTNQLMLFESG